MHHRWRTEAGSALQRRSHTPPVFSCPQVAGSEGQLALYNLLTCAVEWCHPLAVAGLAADPSSQHYAVLLPSAAVERLAASQRAGQAQQAQQAAGAVLVFQGPAREPVGGWALQRPAAARALFALPGTPLHSRAAVVSQK